MKRVDKNYTAITEILFSFLLIIGLFSTAYGSTPSGTFIPIIVNIHKDAGVSPEETKKAVEEASKLLKKAGFHLVTVDTNKTATKGDVGNDGVIDWGTEEWKDLIKAGKEEIEKTPNQKGIKVSFVKEPEKGTTTVGWALHKQPVVAIRKRVDAAGNYLPDLTGQAVAHEIAHILSLSEEMQIDSSTKSDADGHVLDKNNLMYPYNTLESKDLTKAQIEEMQTRRYVHGKCSTQYEKAYPAEKEKQQFGAKTNETSLLTSHRDLFSTSLWSLADNNSLWGQLTLGDTFGDSVNATYTLTFDADNDPGTGFSYKGFLGMEYALEMAVTSNNDDHLVTALIRDLSNNNTQEISDNITVANAKLMDGEAGSIPGLGQLLFKVDKSLIGLYNSLEKEIIVGVTSEEHSGIFDTDTLIFDLDRWLDDPTLKTSGNGVPIPGDDYQFSVFGLKPDDPFNLFLDEDLVFSGQLDSTGSFLGSFIFPSFLSNQESHFLTAQDSTGEFGYSITCPTPEPSTYLLFLLGLIGITVIKKKMC